MKYDQQQKAFFRVIFRGFLRLLLLLALVGALAGGYLWFSTELPSPERLRARAARGNTRILDRQGRLLYQVPDPLSGQQQPVALDDVPLALRQATVAVEDRSFYHNRGVDVRGILRAAWHNLMQGEVVAGGSTVTQQVARNFLLAPEAAQQRTLERKLRETVLALKLNAHFSKDEILALYLNQSYYGGMRYGVAMAAEYVFGKPVAHLDVAECALLAGLPQAPSHYDPLVNPAAAQARQAQVLEAMVDAGYLSPEQAEAARAEPLQFVGGDTLAQRDAPHVVAYVLAQLTEAYGPEVVLRGGLTVTTTLDIDLQRAAQESLQRHVTLLSTPRHGALNHQVHNGAVVVLNPSDGAILAMVGSPDFTDRAHQGQVNAALARRQPGSALKPLTYAAALERGWTAATMLLDAPASFPTREGRPYAPENYGQYYQGEISLRRALATSSNVVAVRTLDHVGVPALLDMAARLGIESLGRQGGRYGLSLTLGGGEVTLLELSAAYAAFANGGERVTPFAVVAVAGGPDSAAVAWGGAEQTRALSPQIAYLITDILSDRYARMPVFGSAQVLRVDRPAAVKTGTSTDWRDNWTVGYSPDRVVGVWVGNASGAPMHAISGVSGAGPVWHAGMLAAHHGLPPRAFAVPAGVVPAAVCADSGLSPASGCAATRMEWFVAGTAPAGAVGHSQRQGAGAPPHQTRPPRRNDDNDAMVPVAARPAPTTDATPALVTPAPGAVFSFAAGIPRERQQIAIEARAASDAAQVTLLLDGAPLAVFEQPPYRTLWPLERGDHRVWVEVQTAGGAVRRSAEVVFTVR